MKILAVSGSLRQQSNNTAALAALSRMAPDGVDVTVFDGIADLPLFNPDLDENEITSVKRLKDALGVSDGLVIASPEYAHGISGVMKNTLDWLVSGEEFVYMPVMLVNTSPRAHHAQEALREVITTMSGIIIDRACLSLPLLGSELDVEGILKNTELTRTLASYLSVFCEEIQQRRSQGRGAMRS